MRKSLISAFCVPAAGIASSPAFAQIQAEPGGWHGGWDWGWGHMIFGSLMMVLLWGGIIVAIVLAVRWVGSGSSHGTPPVAPRNKALDILQERFARGEIDKEEFEERRRLLSDGNKR